MSLDVSVDSAGAFTLVRLGESEDTAGNDENEDDQDQGDDDHGDGDGGGGDHWPSPSELHRDDHVGGRLETGRRLRVDRKLLRVSIDPRVDIGHVHLKVADIERALEFWHGVLGFDVTHRLGDQAAFLSAGGYHHHIGLNTWESRGGSPPPPGTTGLYHVAIRYPNRRALAGAVRGVLDAGTPLEGASDHGVSEAIYLRDPDSCLLTLR